MTKVAVIFAEGFEEVEAVTIVDVLRRAEFDLKMVGLDGREPVRGAQGISVGVDTSLEDIDAEPFDLVVLPGGMPGSTHLRESERLGRFLKARGQDGTVLAAICAAPTVLAHHGLLDGHLATAYPAFQDQLTGATLDDQAVVWSEDRLTSRGVGTALDFSLALVERFNGTEARQTMAKQLVIPGA